MASASRFQSPQWSAFGILALIVLVFTIYSDFRFLSPINISNILAFMPELGLIALAMTLLLTAGEFDLSVGAVFALGQVVVLLLAQNVGLDVGVAALAGLVLCVAIGLVNGLLVTKIGISSFLVTLSMMFIARGVSLYITQGFPLTSWDGGSVIQMLLSGRFRVGPFTIYASLVWFIALTILAAYVLNRSKLGNWISAIGSNRSAAVARGVPADSVKIGLFVVTSVMAGFAGLISAFRISTASPTAGTAYELEVIAMVVVGGTALTGGRGTIIGTLIGIILLRCIRNGIVMIGVPGLAYHIFVGTIILGMLVLHAYLQKNRQRSA